MASANDRKFSPAELHRYALETWKGQTDLPDLSTITEQCFLLEGERTFNPHASFGSRGWKKVHAVVDTTLKSDSRGAPFTLFHPYAVSMGEVGRFHINWAQSERQVWQDNPTGSASLDYIDSIQFEVFDEQPVTKSQQSSLQRNHKLVCPNDGASQVRWTGFFRGSATVTVKRLPEGYYFERKTETQIDEDLGFFWAKKYAQSRSTS